MLPKNSRLSRLEVGNLFKNGKRMQSNNLTLIYSQSDSGKFAVLVPKSIDKRSTQRNTIKRVIFKALHKSTNAPLHAIFLCKPGVLRQKQELLAEEVVSLVQKFLI